MLLVRCVLLLWLLAGAAQADEIRLIGYAETWRYLKGFSEPATNGAVRWFEVDYPDATWEAARSGFGSRGVYGEVTELPDYGAGYTTIYFRKEFTVSDPLAVADLVLRLDFDDGFVAYLNGREVARWGVAEPPGTNVPVNGLAQLHLRGSAELLPLNEAIQLLQPGTNLLAIQLVGSKDSDLSFSMNPELLANVIRGPHVQSTTATSVQIVWRTFSVASSWIEYGINSNEVEQVAVAVNGTEHAGTITGLEADTKYTYRIVNQFGEKQAVSDWRTFRTFKNSGSVVFHVVGDTGWGSVAQLVVAEQMERSSADFVMHVGDLVYYAITPQNADHRLFSVYTKEMQRRPWFLALGNHEMYADREEALRGFYLPTNSVTGTEHYYSFDHGEVHFVVAWSDLAAGSSYHPDSAQYDWLDADLGSSSKPWKVLFFHHPWRSSGEHQIDDYDLDLVPDSEELDAGLGVLARKHGVQMVFNGHDHEYERLGPDGGTISFVTGGGGASLYPMKTPHRDNAQFHPAFHFLRVSVEESEARVEAVKYDGRIFDRVHVRREFPERAVHGTAWRTPVIESGEANDLDGNVAGQKFDFAGEPLTGRLGAFSSAGRLFVNNDRTNLYLGLDEVMLGAGEELFLFLEVPGLAGRTNMVGVGDGIVDADGEGVDALDFLETVAFTNFSPSIAVVLGDEFGDSVSRSFRRSGNEISSGQGAFYLTERLPEVREQRLAQYNISPQVASVTRPHEQNADFVEVALPLSGLGGLKAGDTIRVGAITGLRTDTNRITQAREIDTGGIGYSVTNREGITWLEGVEVRLTGLQDADGDGLSDEEEIALKTDGLKVDSDEDGMPDAWEVIHSLDPLLADGQVDADGDGLTNEMEFRAGTNPRLASSGLRLETEVMKAGGWVVKWSSVPGKRYRLECRDSFTEPFRVVDEAGFPRVAQGPEERFSIDLNTEREGKRYYRVTLVEE